VAGFDVFEDPIAVKARVGYLPELPPLYPELSVGEQLLFAAEIRGIPRGRRLARVGEVMERVGLRGMERRLAGELSKGYRQRVGLAQALVHDPAVLILDEPTSGLDPVGRRLVRDIIRDLRQRGVTVFLNSHLLSEVEITCDRVAFIKHGEVLQVSPLQQMVEGEVSVTVRAAGLTAEIVGGLSRWSHNFRQDGDQLSLTLSSETAIAEVNRYLVAQGVQVFALQPQRISLEDLFIQVVGTDGGL
jgi:ABC-2 type transport system ATP-binding protein